MGIEAFCPNGHRMKVKDHLAGRLGVCPTCGSRFRLPDITTGEPPVPEAAASATPATTGLPIARPIPIDPSFLASLPKAVPYAGVPAAIDAASAEPQAPTPTTTAPHSQIPLGRVPLGQVPLGQVPVRTVPLGTVPLGNVPLGPAPVGTVPGIAPWPPETASPEMYPPADPVADWSAPERSQRVVQRTRRDAGGGGMAVVLLIVVAAAALVAFVVLRSRGLMP